MPPRSAAPRTGARVLPPMAGAPRAALIALAAIVVVLLASYRVNDYDVWQHLLVGKVVWQTHAPPTTHLWTWPSHGQPDLNSSWGFEALLFAFHRAAGVTGLFLWRWWTALATLALALLAARSLGARGAPVVLVCVLGQIASRDRMEPRPETLSAVLLAAFVWLLERRRAGHGDAVAWLPALSLLWANTHLSWFLGPALVALHALVADRRSRGQLWVIFAACVATSFINPFGWRALWEPFDFFLHRSHELIYLTVRELKPVDPREWRELAPLALLLWPLLFLRRVARGRWDPVELVLLVVFSFLAWRARRFLGAYCIVMAPYAARGAEEWLAARSARLRAWTAGGRGAAATAGLCVALALPTLTRAEAPIGIGINPLVRYDGVCDFIERHDMRGRMFNQFETGGYLLWRLWPERLPFTDVHQAGTPADMDTYIRAIFSEPWWRQLEERFQFDHAVINRRGVSDSLTAFLERDTTWARVFADPQALLYVKRGTGFDKLIEAPPAD